MHSIEKSQIDIFTEALVAEMPIDREARREKDRTRKGQQRWRRKIDMFEQMGGKCVDCGNTDLRVIEWDHVTDPQNKTAHPNHLPQSRYRIEIEQHCQPRCANCHRIITIVRNNRAYLAECLERTAAKSEASASSDDH